MSGFFVLSGANRAAIPGILTTVVLVEEDVQQSHHRPEEAQRVPGGWDFQIPRQLVHEGGKVVSPTHHPPLPPRKYTWYSFLLEAESNPRPSGLQRSASTNCATTCPHCHVDIIDYCLWQVWEYISIACNSVTFASDLKGICVLRILSDIYIYI